MSLFDAPAFHRALFFPRRDATDAPRGARDVFVEVPAARLHVRIHGGPARTALLLFHGNGEVVSDYDDAVPLFAAAGVRLVVADFRGYGRSTGAPTLRDTIADAHAVLGTVTSELSSETDALVVMGRSLGGSCAAELCRTPTPAVRGYVFESAATDLVGLVARRGVFGEPITDLDRATFDPLAKMAQCTTPALFLHGEEDTLIRPEEARRGHAAIPGSKLVMVPGRGHNDVSFSEIYWDALRRFVAEVVPST